MLKLTVSKAWRPDREEYGEVEIRMAPDFERDHALLWGLVVLLNLPFRVRFELLRIIGMAEWFERFDWLNWDPATKSAPHPWQQALGGGSGGSTALAGIHSINSKFTCKRIEVEGVPGPGVLYKASPKPAIRSGLFKRTGWPIYGTHDAGSGGGSFSGIVSQDHWFSHKWGQHGQARGIGLRRLEPLGVCARGELVLNEADYELVNYQHDGDGVSAKLAGTNISVRGYRGGPLWLGGTVKANLENKLYADPVLYRHLRESRDIVLEDGLIAGAGALVQERAPLWVSGFFTTPPVMQRFVIRRTDAKQLFAAQLNTGARMHFEDCDFIGWGTDLSKVFELDKRQGFESDVDLVNCRGFDA